MPGQSASQRTVTLRRMPADASATDGSATRSVAPHRAAILVRVVPGSLGRLFNPQTRVVINDAPICIGAAPGPVDIVGQHTRIGIGDALLRIPLRVRRRRRPPRRNTKASADRTGIASRRRSRPEARFEIWINRRASNEQRQPQTDGNSAKSSRLAFLRPHQRPLLFTTPSNWRIAQAKRRESPVGAMLPDGGAPRRKPRPAHLMPVTVVQADCRRDGVDTARGLGIVKSMRSDLTRQAGGIGDAGLDAKTAEVPPGIAQVGTGGMAGAGDGTKQCAAKVAVTTQPQRAQGIEIAGAGHFGPEIRFRPWTSEPATVLATIPRILRLSPNRKRSDRVLSRPLFPPTPATRPRQSTRPAAFLPVPPTPCGTSTDPW